MILVYGRNQRGENWNVVISLRHIILQLYAYLYQKCKFIRRFLPFLALKTSIFAHHALRDLSVALEERELQELNQISAALARISAGDFGSCTDCGADIPDARLQANPVAARCIACQTLVENAHGKVHTHTL